MWVRCMPFTKKPDSFKSHISSIPAFGFVFPGADRSTARGVLCFGCTCNMSHMCVANIFNVSPAMWWRREHQWSGTHTHKGSGPHTHSCSTAASVNIVFYMIYAQTWMTQGFDSTNARTCFTGQENTVCGMVLSQVNCQPNECLRAFQGLSAWRMLCLDTRRLSVSVPSIPVVRGSLFHRHRLNGQFLKGGAKSTGNVLGMSSIFFWYSLFIIHIPTKKKVTRQGSGYRLPHWEASKGRAS